MARPDPEPGLVLRYDYLWESEARRGREEGAKLRPCAIVVVVRADESGKRLVLLCPIAHSRPREKESALEIPAVVSRRLGLDEDRSWIVISESNLVDWSDPGFTPMQGSWAYGYLPSKLTRAVVDTVRDRIRSKKLDIIDRPQIENARIPRDRSDARS